MIAALRRAHRWSWAVLGVAVPALVIAAWSVRPGDELAGRPSALGVRHDEIAGTALRFEPALAHGAIQRDGRLAVVLQDEAPLAFAYWSTTPAQGPSLPSDAVLLGRVDGVRVARFEPPAGAGTLVIYSLGHHAVLTRAACPLDEARGG